MQVNKSDMLRERRPNQPQTGAREEGTANRDSFLHKVNLERFQNDPNFAYRIKSLLWVISFMVAFLIIYSYEPKNNLNKIFFRYGFPADEGWKQNELLKNAKYICKGKLKGPQAIVFGENGLLYTGLSNGQIISIDKNEHMEKIIQIGDEMDERVCDNVKEGYIAEPICGRPFGLRIKHGTNFLYAADPFYGIVKVDLQNKTKSIVISSNDTRFEDKPLKLSEDLDIDGDNIYFIDSSYKHDLNHALVDIISNDPIGRLFRYNEKTDKLELLLDNLYFPNGIQLTPMRDAILVNEFSKGRIIKFYLSGEKKGKIEIFTELPGLSDEIRSTEYGTILVPFVSVVPKSPSILGFLGKFSIIRSIIGLFLSPKQVYNLLPKYGLVAEFDLNGNLIKTWHDTSGEKINSITTAVLNNKKLYLGSFSMDYIAVVNY